MQIPIHVEISFIAAASLTGVRYVHSSDGAMSAARIAIRPTGIVAAAIIHLSESQARNPDNPGMPRSGHANAII